MRYVAHPQRIRAGLDALMQDYYAGKHPFVEGIMEFPQEERNMPPELPRGGIEEANYWMWVCHYMLGATDSMTMARRVAFNLYPKHADALFDWSVLAHMNPATVSQYLIDAGLDYRASEDRVPAAAIENAKRTNRRWKGDIRNAFTAAGKDWRKLYQLLTATPKGDGLVGYQGKMASMLAFYFMRRGITPYFKVPPQVDFHVMRVFWSCNFVVPAKEDGAAVYVLRNQQVSKYAEAIKPHLLRYAEEADQNWLDLSDALWTLSRAMCSLSPSNSMSKDDNEEPFQRPILWSPNQIARYDANCGQCALSSYCSNAIPSAYYYGRKATELRVYGPRQTPPHTTQVLFND